MTFMFENPFHKRVFKILKGCKTGEKAVVFTGIKWALNEGDVSNLIDNDEPVKLKLPVGINVSSETMRLLFKTRETR